MPSVGLGTSIVYDITATDNASRVFRNVASQAQQSANQMVKTGRAMSSVGRSLSLFTLPMAAAGAASVKMATQFQSSMVLIENHAGASAKQVQAFSKALLDSNGAFKNAQQGPNDLAQALYHLRSTGIANTATALKDLKVASDLAAIGNTNLEDTTNALAGVMQVGMAGIGKNAAAAAAQLNAVTGAGNMTMKSLTDALGTGILPSAKLFGLQFKDVGAALAVFTDEGVPADAAATRLRMSFSLLGAPTLAAQKALSAIGITQFELGNDMRQPNGLITAIGDLRDHLKASGEDATEQANTLSRAFGGGRSSAAVMSLVNNFALLQKKQEQINETTSEYGNAVKTQAQTAQAQFKEVEATVQRAGINLGDDLLPLVVKLASAAEAVANGFEDMPQISQKATIAFGLALTAAGPILVVTGNIVRTIGQIRTAMLAMGTQSQKSFGTMAASAEEAEVAAEGVQTKVEATGASLNMVGRVGSTAAKGLGVATAAFIGIQVAASGANAIIGQVVQSNDAVTKSLQGLKSGGDLAAAFKMPNATGDIDSPMFGLVGLLSDLGPKAGQAVVSINSVGDAFKRIDKRDLLQQANDALTGLMHAVGLPEGQLGQLQDQFKSVDTALASEAPSKAASQFKILEAQLKSAGATTAQIKALFPQYYAALGRVKEANTETAASTVTYADAVQVATTQLKANNQQLAQQRSTLIGLGQTALTTAGAQVAFDQSIDDATAAIKKNGDTLNLNTQKGRDNASALQNIASAALSYKSDLDKSNASVKQQNDEIDKGRDAFIRTAEQMGDTKAQAKKLADQYKLIPTTIPTNVKLTGAQEALNMLDQIQQTVDKASGKTITVKYNVLSGTTTRSSSGGGDVATTRAGGGAVWGAGTATSDSIDAKLSNGEYVIKESSARSIGYGNLDRANATGHFALGGLVINDKVAGSAAAIKAILAGSTRATNAARSAAQAAASASVPAGLSGSTSGALQAYAKSLMASHGWSNSNWPSLKALWNGESGWNPAAYNAASGATGIPQALPGSKMASAGADWRTNGDTQIRWGEGYIASVYGNPTNAYSKWLSRSPHWYARGTNSAAPGLAIVGERGPEAVMMKGGEQVVPHYAAGGLVNAFGSSSKYSIAQIVADIMAVANPANQLGNLTSSVSTAQHNSNVANSALHAPTKALNSATAAYNKAVTQRNNLRAENAKQLKSAKDEVASRKSVVTAMKAQLTEVEKLKKSKQSEAEVTAAKNAVDKAEAAYSKAEANQSKVSRTNTLQLADANKKVSDTEAAKTKATNAYNKASTVASNKAAALKTAQQNLAQEQQAVAQSTTSMASSISSFYTPGTSSSASLLQSYTEGATDITKFTKDIAKLRSMKLNETVIGQVISEATSAGVPTGDAFAMQIIQGGAKLVSQLNSASTNFNNAANIFGYKQAISTGGYASGTNSARPGIHDIAENGMELVLGKQARKFKGGEQVLNNAQTRGLLSGGNTFNMTLNVASKDDPDEISKKAATKFGDVLRRYGVLNGAIA